MNERPNPDQLLKHVQADERSSGRGRLKLFFGASPGVGKTYAMLEAAQQRQKEGWDVLVGLVETHHRADTEALLAGLAVLPRKAVAYKEIILTEFDLEAALARRPRLILVDELAHTNAPGLRHAKRWQDVEELLDAGIDVFTALNVQHWETLKDVVTQITGVVVRETVPDTFLKRAHDIELVDLPPEELSKRLQQGKVYLGDLAGRAADNFFKPGNLIALRELALRHVAEHVDAEMQAFKERHAIAQVWPVGDRLLVGISASPMSARLVRATARIANRLHAEWIVAHVETAVFLRLSSEDKSRVAQTLRLAEELGAKSATLSGDDVTEEILNYARARNVTKIVLGKPARPRWKEWFQGSVVNQIARRARDIDLYVISGMGPSFSSRRSARIIEPSVKRGMVLAVGMVALETLICYLLRHALDGTNLIMIYLLGLVWIAYRFGRPPALLASVLSVLAFDFFFVPPAMSFAVSDTQYLVTFGVMLLVGVVISTVTGKLKAQTKALRERGLRAEALYNLSRALSEAPDPNDLIKIAAAHLTEFFQTPLVILLPRPEGPLEIAGGNAEAFDLNEHERGTAQWVFDHAQPGGSGTDTLAGSAALYLPLRGIRSTVGVLSIKAPWTATLDPDRQRLVETFAGAIGGALESTRMSEAIGRAELQMELQAMSRPPTEAGLRLSDFLTASRIAVLPEGISDDQIIRDLVARLSVPNLAQALQAIFEREKAGPTFIGQGVRIPHARLPGLKSLQASLGVSRSGPAHVWLLFVGPVEDPKIHLSFLAKISAFFQDPVRGDALRELQSPDAVLTYLRRAEIPS